MGTARRIASLSAAMLCFGVPLASAAGKPRRSPAAAPAPSGRAPRGPVAGKLALTLQRVGGRPPFAFVGARIVVNGVVWPYVGGQAVKVSIYRDGRKVGVKRVSVAAVGNGAGKFRISVVSGSPGLVQARAAHYATAQQAAFSARSPGVRFIQVNLGPGAQGPSVRLLQSELNMLHYAVPLSGVFDEGTGRTLVAYRKMTGLERVPYAGRRVFELLAHGAGSFHVRYPRRRPARRGRPDQAGARGDRAGRPRPDALHDELRQALDANGHRSLPRLYEDARDEQPWHGRLELLHSADTRSTATPKCRPTPRATGACGCRSRMRPGSTRGSAKGHRLTSTTRAAAAARRCAETPARERSS